MDITTPNDPRSRTNSWTDDHCKVDGAHAFILRVSSFFGMAPLRFTPHENGYIVSISIPMCVYSYILMIGLAAFTFFGLIFELQVGLTQDILLTFRLPQVMTCCDITAIALVISIAIFGAPSRMRSMIKFMNIIASVDKRISFQNSLRTERNLCAGFLLFMLFFIAVHADELCFVVLIFNGSKKWNVAINFLGFYILWFIKMILKMQFAITVMVVYSRFKALNEALSLTAKQLSEALMEKERNTDRNNITARVSTVDSGPEKTQAASLRQSETRAHLMTSISDAIHRISSLHVDLCEVVHILENSYCVSLNILLILVLYHLIICPYFSILEITKSNLSNGQLVHFIILQSSWYIIHILTLLLMVEPCNYITAEVHKIQYRVCRMLAMAPTTGMLASRLKKLGLRLIMHPIRFKPMGICTLERPLIATIFGAVVTYLVILIQLPKN